jgi:hypothetical protein
MHSLEHIQKRVLELGFTDYTYQPVRIELASDEKAVIKAYNELYFLVGGFKASLKIISDTNAIIVDETYNTSGINGLLEFSGLIEVFKLDNQDTEVLDFIRVIPK